MTIEEHRWQRYWDDMTYPQRLQFVAVHFDKALPNDIVWMTQKPFSGYHKWWEMKWDDVE